MRNATLSRRDMLWAMGALIVGAACAEPPQAAAAEPSGAGSEPTSWVDAAMPAVTHRMIETNGIRLHVVLPPHKFSVQHMTMFVSSGFAGKRDNCLGF